MLLAKPGRCQDLHAAGPRSGMCGRASWQACRISASYEPECLGHDESVVVDCERGITRSLARLGRLPELLMPGPPFRDRGISLAFAQRVVQVYERAFPRKRLVKRSTRRFRGNAGRREGGDDRGLAPFRRHYAGDRRSDHYASGRHDAGCAGDRGAARLDPVPHDHLRNNQKRTSPVARRSEAVPDAVHVPPLSIRSGTHRPACRSGVRCRGR
jgi:hypothetical protein